MKNKFSGYYNYSEEEFKQLWENGLIVFDTNVLLDLYRLSPSTVKYLFKLMEKIQNQLWIPYHVANEFHNRFCEIIAGQANEYKSTIEDIKKLKIKFDSQNHPFLSKSLKKKADALFRQLELALRGKERSFNKLLTDNKFKDRIALMFEGKVGDCFSQEKLNLIYNEGSQRYAKEIPPGYKDNKKPEPEKYGDLVIWKELIEKAKTTNQGVIFVTRDSKEDWFFMVNKNTIGPRPELIYEFKEECGNNFYIYNTHRFIEYCQKHLNVAQNKKALAEFKDFALPPISLDDILKLWDTSPSNNYGLEPALLNIIKDKNYYNNIFGIDSKIHHTTSASSEDNDSTGKITGESAKGSPPDVSK